jgi:hypothetical protein
MCLANRIRLAHESAYERAPPSVRLPIYVQSRTAIGIGQRYGWHRVSQLGQGWIKGRFVPAEMVFFVNRAGLHGRELPGAQQRYSVMLRIDHQFHGRRNYSLRVTQKFTSHLVRESDQCRTLLRSCLVVHEKNSQRRIGIRVWITQSGVGMHSGGNRQSVQRNPVPASALDVPRQDGLIAYEVDFAVGETLSGVYVGAAGLDVITANLLPESRCRKKQECNAKKSKEMPHGSPHPKLFLLLSSNLGVYGK